MKKKLKMTLIITGALVVVLLIAKFYLDYNGTKFNEKSEQIYSTLNKPTAEINHKTVTSNGCDIHYFVSGNPDGELIVFLHPAFSDHKAFDPQVDAFSTDFRVVTVDMIGHGLSVSGKSKDKIDATPDHIARIIEAEGYDKAHLVGVSMGSLMAQYFAVQSPEKVSSMTILGGYDINKVNDEITKAQNGSNFGLIVRAILSMSSFRATATPLTAYTEKGQAWFYESMKLYNRKSFMVMPGMVNVIKDRDFKPAYPIYILCGEHDLPLSVEMAKKMHEAIPESCFEILSGAGHCANLDTPEKFNEKVINFINTQNLTLSIAKRELVLRINTVSEKHH